MIFVCSGILFPDKFFTYFFKSDLYILWQFKYAMKYKLLSRVSSFLAAIAILTASSSFFTSVSADESKWPIGDEWLYRYSDSYAQESYEGEMKYVCVGKTHWKSELNSIDVIEFRSWTRGNISGEGFGFSLSGNFSIDSIEYYDINTGSIVAYSYREEMRVIEIVDFRRSYWNYTEYNITEYIPPGGLGFEPVPIVEGIIWHKNYTIRSHSNGTAQEVEFDVYSNYTEHVKYTFLGFETISVPAGSYYSSVLREEYDDGSIGMVWYSDTVSNFVKIIYTYPEGETLEIILTGYSRFSGSPIDEYAISPWNWLFFVFLGATAGAAITAWVIVNRKKIRDESVSEQNSMATAINQDFHLKR